MAPIKNTPVKIKTTFLQYSPAQIIIGILLWFKIIFLTFFFAIVILCLFPIVYLADKERHFLHTIVSIWAKTIANLYPGWQFEITGRENIAKKNHPVVYVLNHQSQTDILALYIVNMRFRWLAKDSLFNVPIMGWGMRAVGYVPVIRGNQKSGEKCMQICAQKLRNGTPIAFFPEGTRSKDGTLGAFKNGAFRLACAEGVPIVPITLNGCAQMLPKGSIIPRPAKMTVIIHPALSSNDISVEELMQKARASIESSLLPIDTQKKD